MLSIPILMYHRLGYVEQSTPQRSLYVSPEQFEAQMEFLAVNHYHSLSFADLLPLLSGEKEPLPRAVIITFDDGFSSIYHTALPVLNRYQMTAVVFVVTGYVGKKSSWCTQGCDDRLLCWEEINEMQRHGICFESHTVSHAHLTQLPALEVKRELTSSRQQLEQKMGQPVTCLAYPYGEYNEQTTMLAQEAGYSCACSVRHGNRHTWGELFRLKRVVVGPDTTLLRFKYRLSTLYDLEYRLKQKDH